MQEEGDRIIAWFPEDADLSRVTGELEGELRTIEETDWSMEWRRRVRSVRVGPFFVAPPWLVDEAPAGMKMIVIEPEMAFGTGDHATTRGCLAMLARHVKEGDRVLDFGCGSGILGIASCLLGARDVVAADSDPVAVEIARKNADVNKVRLTLLGTDVPPDSTFDVIVANIQTSVLEHLVPKFRALLAPGGTIILSGILSEESFVVEGVKGRIVEGEWVTLEVR